MTDRELLEQALEALEEMGGGYSQNLIAALRERLAQPEREWVGLTDDELWDLWNSYTEEPFPEWFVDFKKAYEVIEAKLKEKNT